MGSIANDITAEKKKLGSLLSEKYTIDYFQREYKWERKHIEQLLVDLEAAFISNYEEGDTIAGVSNYNCYYLGPVVVSRVGRNRSIVDGQQRLTSITLLLIYLNNLQKDKLEQEQEVIAPLIFSRKGGINSYNIEVEERQGILDALFSGAEIDIDSYRDFSVRNMYDRYMDIVELFPESLRGDKLPMFIEWLKESVVFVEILAYSNENAYTIFETMNDRGLNLTPTEMLKGYILSNIGDEAKIDEINTLWRENILRLNNFSYQEDQEFFRAWLRGCYAETIRQSIKGAENEDFEKIGTRFHTWVRDNHKKIGLQTPEAYYYFVKSNFSFYVNLYMRIVEAERNLTEQLEIVFLASKWNIAASLTYPLILGAVNIFDDEPTIIKKINIIYQFLDVFTVTRMVNYKSITQTAIRYTIYSLVKEVRNKSVEELSEILRQRLENSGDSIDALALFDCYNANKKFVQYLLARMTYYMEKRYADENHLNFWDLLPSRRWNRIVITPIMTTDADYLPYFRDEEQQISGVKKIGNYVLVPNSYYSEFTESNQIEKLELIKNSNILSKTLVELVPMANEFQVQTELGAQMLEQRTEELVRLACTIWNADLIKSR